MMATRQQKLAAASRCTVYMQEFQQFFTLSLLLPRAWTVTGKLDRCEGSLTFPTCGARRAGPSRSTSH
eukprot:5460861-Amphidinium_carterae.1